MRKNPLRDLLNRIKHDEYYDQTKCFIEYEDFESGVAQAPLILCEIESRNISCSDVIIPFHRIVRIIYKSEKIYPFDRAGS